MLDLMPKISELKEQWGGVENIIRKYKKTEVQFFRKTGMILDFEFETIIEEYIKEFDLKEVTIHPPLDYYDIEAVIYYDKSIIHKQLYKCVEISEKYNVKINLLYHTHLPIQYSKLISTKPIKEMLKIIENTNVYLIIENLYLIQEERDSFSALDLVREIDHPHLKMCFDICHAYCQANMFEVDIEEWLKNKFNDKECDKYISQIHFSYTANNDGYKDQKNTHGVGHPNIDSLKFDWNLLDKYGLTNKTIVTEISENDYFHRKFQLQDIEWLESIN